MFVTRFLFDEIKYMYNINHRCSCFIGIIGKLIDIFEILIQEKILYVIEIQICLLREAEAVELLVNI